MVIEIKGYKVLISDCDAEKVKSHNWYIKTGWRKGQEVYFACTTPRPNRKCLILHRFIVDCPKGMVVDHINGNTLDNRRENLRICTPAENTRNYRKPKTNTSGFKGVSWINRFGKWHSAISVNGKNKSLGYFDTPEEAYKAYCEASKKYHKEFGRTA